MGDPNYASCQKGLWIPCCLVSLLILSPSIFVTFLPCRSFFPRSISLSYTFPFLNNLQEWVNDPEKHHYRIHTLHIRTYIHMNSSCGRKKQRWNGFPGSARPTDRPREPLLSLHPRSYTLYSEQSKAKRRGRVIRNYPECRKHYRFLSLGGKFLGMIVFLIFVAVEPTIKANFMELSSL